MRAFVRRDWIGNGDRDEMMGWEHGGGCSMDASMCIGDTGRAEQGLNDCCATAAVAAMEPLPVEMSPLVEAPLYK